MNLNKFQTNALPFLTNVRDMSNFMWGQGLGSVLMCTRLVKMWTYNKKLIYFSILIGLMHKSTRPKPIPFKHITPIILIVMSI